MDWLLLTGKVDQIQFSLATPLTKNFYYPSQRSRVAGTMFHILYPTEQTHTHLQTGQNDPTGPYGASEPRL
jgi:hypothetical protein